MSATQGQGRINLFAYWTLLNPKCADRLDAGGTTIETNAPSNTGLTSGALIAIVVLGVMLLGACTAFGVVIIRRRKREETNSYPAREANYGSMSYARLGAAVDVGAVVAAVAVVVAVVDLGFDSWLPAVDRTLFYV